MASRTKWPSVSVPAVAQARAAVSLAVLTTSPRTPSESARVGRHIERLLAAQYALDGLDRIDLGALSLPACTDPTTGSDHDVASLLQALARADGFVIVVPEWGGMAPPGLKNLFLHCDGRTELAHKPALIIAISSGMGGAYPVAELRMSSYKNTRICYLPEHVIVRNVEAAFNPSHSYPEPEVQLRLRRALCLLVGYSENLKAVRAYGIEFVQQFPYGM